MKYLSVCRGKNKPCLRTSRLRTAAFARNIELVPTSDIEKNSLDLDTIDASSVGPVEVRSSFDEDGKLQELAHQRITLHVTQITVILTF